ncbi:hypothetical protein [Nodosilinea sp. FACHB-13]|uniref:hypothetical protein n=1 Tax=Cyanophyceae TaxID=3028117 RepID=UPI0018EF4741|nr:hypothetical protein [Nodosilinea sp. FACHB-13]
MLKEVFCDRIDILITEDRKIHKKSDELDVSHKVFNIDSFLEKVNAENPQLADYQVLSVKREYFGNMNLEDSFFDSLKEDYPGFDRWFNRKADETAYICRSDEGALLAFLYIKIEDFNENYYDIQPAFKPKKRLKIGTFKVILNGFKLGERFLKIAFDNALLFCVDEIYVTVFNRTSDQQRLMFLLEDWGFSQHGIKGCLGSGEEVVLTRSMSKAFNSATPRHSYPYISKSTNKFIVPIYPEYHTELFPDSILKTESHINFVENKPNRNAIQKVYISRSYERNLSSGDIIVFYRTKFNGSAHYTSVATTLGIVESVITNIPNLSSFISLCRKRSVFTDAGLAKYWNYDSGNRPFIVNFLYAYSFPKRPILKVLLERGIIDEAPRGFKRLNDIAFDRLLEEANAEHSFIVD